jgi:hypothetical protein
MQVAIYQVQPTSESTPSLILTQNTGNRGNFTFAVKPGDYMLAALPDQNSRFVMYRSERIRVDANKTLVINLQAGFILAGKVLSENGQPFRSGAIAAFDTERRKPGLPLQYQALSNITTSGDYCLVVDRGDLVLAHFASGTKAFFIDQTIGLNVKSLFPEINVSEDTDQVTRTLFRVSVHKDTSFDLVFPTLVDFKCLVKNNNDEPVTDAIVILRPLWADDQGLEGRLDQVEQKTDALGKCQFFAEPGAYRIAVQPEQSSPYFSYEEEHLEIWQDEFKPISLSQGHRLKGQVKADGQPLSGCEVIINAAADQAPIVLATNEDGKFSCVLTGGAYRVCARPSKTTGSNLAPGFKSIVVNGDCQVGIALKSGVSVSGKIVGAQGHRCAGVRVFFFAGKHKAAGEFDLSEAIASELTDETGNYLTFLLPGTYQLVVHRDYAHAQEIKIEDEPAVIDGTWLGWHQVRFELSGANNESITDCQMTCYPYSKDFDAANALLPDRFLIASDRAVSDRSGTCQITIPTGVYSFSFSPSPESPYQERVIRQLSVSSDLVRKVKLPQRIHKLSTDQGIR